jgi:NAD(P)-dependent dehydrogenase (short-subunit alcohol dehydrogenase family)
MNKEKIINLFKIDGKVIVITGGAGFLAKTYAEILADAGAIVVLADIDKEGVTKQMKQLSIGGRLIESLQVDVTDKKSVIQFVAEVVKKYKKIDVLINNAAINPKVVKKGIVGSSAFEDFPEELWKKELAVDLNGMFLISQAVGKQMLKQKKGVIINISSMYGLVSPNQNLYKPEKGEQTQFKPVSYATAKAAILNFTRYLATYWAKSGLRVNCLVPGGVYENQPDDFLVRYADFVPMGRMAKKEELTGPILFLASDASSYMTGATLVIDGGWTAW